MSEDVKTRSNWRGFIIYLILLALSVEVVYLTLQNRKLKTELSLTSLGVSGDPLQSGDRVPPIKLHTLGGSTADLQYNDPMSQHLLFVFSTTCPHCAKTLPIWQAIAESVKGRAVTVVGISEDIIDETTKYIMETHPNFYIAVADSSFRRQYKIVGLPETILSDGRGAVQKVWVGELTLEKIKDIQRLTTIEIPSNSSGLHNLWIRSVHGLSNKIIASAKRVHGKERKRRTSCKLSVCDSRNHECALGTP